jgi:hypothetical protein
MPMQNAIALAILALAGLYLLGLGVSALAAPARTRAFFGAFAASARAHYVEQAARLAVGAALQVHSPRMPFPAVFNAAGWLLVGTTLALLAMPWHWHRRFANRVVPPMLRYLGLVGIVSALMGVALLGVLAAGSAARP